MCAPFLNGDKMTHKKRTEVCLQKAQYEKIKEIVYKNPNYDSINNWILEAIREKLKRSSIPPYISTHYSPPQKTYCIDIGKDLNQELTKLLSHYKRIGIPSMSKQRLIIEAIHNKLVQQD